MIGVNYSNFRSNLKEYCDKATDQDEIILVTRKGDKNVIVMSQEQYNQMCKKNKISTKVENK